MIRNPIFALLGCVSLGIANQAVADIMTIDPGDFTSGQYVSYATPGVTLSAMTLLPVNTAPDGEGLYVPNLGPVYAVDGLFASNPNPPNLYDWGFSGLLAPMASCLHGCITAPAEPGSRSEDNPWLRVDFSNPVNFVSAIQTHDSVDYAELAAFNSAGQLVADCHDAAYDSLLSGGCVTLDPSEIGSNGLPIPGYLPAHWTVQDSLADISTVLIASTDPTGDTTQIGAIEYGDVPEPATLGLMLLGLLGIAYQRRQRRA